MKIIDKKMLKEVLKSWADRYTLLCPTKTKVDDVIFDVFNTDTFTLEYTKPSLPPKSSYLPQSEVIFEVEDGRYKEVLTRPNTILFGIRPCDMAGILQARSFMMRDNNDEFYASRSEDTIIAVMACPGPQNETCFCTTTKTGPYAFKGYDLQFYDTGESLLVESGSEKGSELLDHPAFSQADEASSAGLIKDYQDKAVEAIPIIPQVESAMDRLKRQVVGDDFWEKFGDKCITCGGCVFVCPTCTCFNVVDSVTAPEKGERIRTWDACLYSGFTKEASGHNPRATPGLRLKRRHEHKLLYYNETDVGEGLCGCVGCGRCSDYCPVHIGTIEIVKAIDEHED